MKKRLFVLLFISFILLIGSACSHESSDTNEPSKNESSQNENSLQNDEKKENGNQPDEKNGVNALSQIPGIFYSAQEEHPDILIFDFALYEKPMILNDEARVFFSGKPMNTLVELQLEENNRQLEIVSAKSVDTLQVQAQYIGLSDNNHAIFQFGEKGFVVQISSEMNKKIAQLTTDEQYTVTIRQNEIEQANPVLTDLQ